MYKKITSLLFALTFITTTFSGCVVLTEETTQQVSAVLDSVVADINNTLDNNATVGEIRTQFENLLDTVKFDELTEAASTTTEFSETQTATFKRNMLDDGFVCKYTFTTGNVVGSSDFTYYNGEYNKCLVDGVLTKTIKCYKASQNFDSISEAVELNHYIGVVDNNSTVWHKYDTKTEKLSVLEESDVNEINMLDVDKLLFDVCKESNYKHNVITNIVNVGAVDVDLFEYEGNTYAYMFNKEGILTSVTRIDTQETYMFSAFDSCE